MHNHIIFIGTTLPSPGFGSAVVFYRHLKRLKGWKITLIVNEQGNKPNLPIEWDIIEVPELINKSFKRRIPFALNFRLNKIRTLIDKKLKNKPSIIINQFGKNSILACYSSKKWKVPLNLVMHDQWEIWVKNGIEANYMKKRWEKKILDHASVLLPISEELGDYYKTVKRKTKVLKPIPEGFDGFVGWKDNFKKPVIVYSGSYHTPYVEIFRLVAESLERFNGKLIIITKKNDLAKKEIGHFSNVEYINPFKTNKGILNFIANNASCLLIPGFF